MYAVLQKIIFGILWVNTSLHSVDDIYSRRDPCTAQQSPARAPCRRVTAQCRFRASCHVTQQRFPECNVCVCATCVQRATVPHAQKYSSAFPQC